MRAPFTTLLVGLVVPSLALGGFTASSFKKTTKSSGNSPYEAAAALDGNVATAWVTDPEQANKGQWIEIDVPHGKVDKVSLVVGWDKDESSWDDHARLKSARVEVISMAGGEAKVVAEKEITLEDKRDRQVIDLAEPEVGDDLEGGKIKITVTDTYAGKDYENLAVAEVLVHLVEFEAKTRTSSAQSSQTEDHPIAHALDDSTKTFWVAGPADAAPSLTLEGGRYSISSLTFVPGPKTHARPKKIELVQGEAKRTYDVPDTAGPHTFELPSLFGYNGSNFGAVTFNIVETWPGSSSTQAALADVRFKATAIEAF